ncbi:hypothetical protein G3N57_01720 [Paraburkholderia sp. Se-20369]|nr:hypothetical protein [Paraburkholderia sp. Se-20369]
MNEPPGEMPTGFMKLLLSEQKAGDGPSGVAGCDTIAVARGRGLPRVRVLAGGPVEAREHRQFNTRPVEHGEGGYRMTA